MTDRSKKKLKRMERDISRITHSLELVRTIIPEFVLVLQIIILIKVV